MDMMAAVVATRRSSAILARTLKIAVVTTTQVQIIQDYRYSKQLTILTTVNVNVVVFRIFLK